MTDKIILEYLWMTRYTVFWKELDLVLATIWWHGGAWWCKLQSFTLPDSKSSLTNSFFLLGGFFL